VATVRRLVARDSVVLLEAWGAAVNDTTLMVATGHPRVIILRHGPPDNTVFAELSLPANGFDSPPGDSVRVTLQPRPGMYGVTITSETPIKSGAVLVFKYAYHFSRPSGTDRYRTNVELEEALFIGRIQDNETVAVLQSTRPASDNLQAVIPAGGTYGVAALR
jgi:hypothetical protein